MVVGRRGLAEPATKECVLGTTPAVPVWGSLGACGVGQKLHRTAAQSTNTDLIADPPIL